MSALLIYSTGRFLLLLNTNLKLPPCKDSTSDRDAAAIRPGTKATAESFCSKQEQRAAAGLEQRLQRDSCSSMLLTDGESERNHN